MEIQWTEPVNGDFIRGVVCGFIGSLLYVTVALCCVYTTLDSDDTKGSRLAVESYTLNIAICFVGALLLLAYQFRRLSGEHYNPAISFGFMFARIFTPIRYGCYILALFAGGISEVKC